MDQPPNNNLNAFLRSALERAEYRLKLAKENMRKHKRDSGIFDPQDSRLRWCQDELMKAQVDVNWAKRRLANSTKHGRGTS